MVLSENSKNIIFNRMIDKKMKIENINELDKLNLYSIPVEDFTEFEHLYNYIIDNFYNIDRIDEDSFEEPAEEIDKISLDSYYTTIDDIVIGNRAIKNENKENDEFYF